MVQADERLVEMLRYLQKEVAEQQRQDAVREAKLIALEAQKKLELARLQEVGESLEHMRYLVDSAEVGEERKLRAAKAGKHSFREYLDRNLEEPKIRVKHDPHDGTWYF